MKKSGKKCYVIQHGYTTLAEHFFPLVNGGMIADKMFVWGRTSKEWMIKNGLDKNNLIITGSPKFDEYHKNNEIRIRIRNIFNIPKTSKIICLIAEANLTQKDPRFFLLNKEEMEFYRTMFRNISKEKDLYLIVKPHPSDRHKNFIDEIMRKENIKNCRIVEKNFPLNALLNQSDIIMTLGSTVTLEAMFFKKPIIIIDLFNKKSMVPFIENKMCVGINKKENLISIIRDEIKNRSSVKKYENVLENYALSDGKSSERISEIILKNN